MSMAADRTYTTTVGSQEVELPLVALTDDLTIALLITVDRAWPSPRRPGASWPS